MDWHLRYHRRWGRLVRVGPGEVSVGFGGSEGGGVVGSGANRDGRGSLADDINTIHGTGSKFIKSGFYSLFDVKDGRDGSVFPTVFSVRDDRLHKDIKRRVHAAYTTNAMRGWEGRVDECVSLFLAGMGRMTVKRIPFGGDGAGWKTGGVEQGDHTSDFGSPFDLGTWLHWFAFDVISSISFSNRLGFMEKEEDVGGIIDAIERRLMYNSTIGQWPVLNKWLLGSKFGKMVLTRFEFFRKLDAAGYVVGFAAKQLRQRNKIVEEDGAGNGDVAGDVDMLARFKRFREDGGEAMSETELLSHASSNIFAGSDTTAVTLRTIMFNLCRSPRSYQKLIEEIDAMDRREELSDLVTYDEAMKMEYLQAVIKEALRIHPVVGQLLERVVPAGGAEIAGVWLPEGTVVGVSPWVASRDPDLYGEDCDDFRPERWIDNTSEQIKKMERLNLGVSHVVLDYVVSR